MEAAIVHRSAAMSKAVALMERVAATDATLLITGENGTGKSLVAETIHRLGERRAKPFVTVACANIPAELFESELFGHEPGAHTDAVLMRPGRFEIAQEGTIFLDGVGALTPPLQAKLLRVVQERAFERLGGTRTIKVDIRIIASAGETLETEAREGRFREDLFYRLNVVHIGLPPLRERLEDIPPLASHFLSLFSRRHGGPTRRLTADARRKLVSYRWPGNVRELANVLESAVIITAGRELGPEALRLPVGSLAEEAIREAFKSRWSLQALESAYIREVLSSVRGNKSRAAEILGINRKTLLAKIKRSGG